MKSIILILPFLLFLSSQASAEPVQNIQEIRISLDSVWVVVGGILVFFMQAGFALIESGSVRSKNTVNVLMKNYMDMCIGGLVFWLFGGLLCVWLGIALSNNVCCLVWST